MHRNPATKLLEKVPGHSHLFRRGARYYFRIGVPASLRSIVGRRELVKSLNTADFRTALERISLEEQTCRDILRRAQAQLESKNKGRGKPRPRQSLIVTSEKHAQDLARSWFLELEREGAQWWQEKRFNLSQEKRDEELADLRDSKAAITGERGKMLPEWDYDDGTHDVYSFLRKHRFTMDEQSKEFALLTRLFREARLEYVCRQADRMKGKPMVSYAPLFHDLTENTTLLPLPKVTTVKQLTAKYLEEIEKAGKAPKTIFQYQVTVRLLCAVLGDGRAAESITREDAEKFCSILETMPEQMSKRYPKMSIEAATRFNRVAASPASSSKASRIPSIRAKVCLPEASVLSG